MIKSIESLENENYIISRISSFSVKSKRRVAEKGDIKLIECSRCELFKSLDEFHTNATGYLKKGSYCKDCTNMKNSEFGSQSKLFKDSVDRDNNLIAFRIGKNGDKYVIEYTIGNSFIFSRANDKYYNNLFEARYDINQSLTNNLKLGFRNEN